MGAVCHVTVARHEEFDVVSGYKCYPWVVCAFSGTQILKVFIWQWRKIWKSCSTNSFPEILH